MACRLAVVPADGVDIRTGLLRGLGMTLALVTLASLGILLSRTLEMNGDAWASVWHDMGIALWLTHFGHVWIWRVPALAIAWFAWARLQRNPGQGRMDWLIALALAAIALTRSDTGHPADQGDFTLAVWADWAHLLAAGAWVGSLFGMSLVVFPKLRDAGDPALASATIFQRLSTLSGVALAVLLAAGIWNAIHQLGEFQALWISRYGVVLDVKIAIVAAMIAIGAHNRYVKLPRLLGAARLASGKLRPTPDIVRGCARAVLLESVLGLAVIGAAATLIHSMPPTDMPAVHALATNAQSTHAIGWIVAAPAHR